MNEVTEMAGTAEGGWQRPAEGLRRILITPLEEDGWLEGIEHLRIVPHGVLHYLPFAALARPPAPPDARPRLLIEDYLLSYLPSVAVSMRAPASNTADGDLLALAPQPERLPHSAREARAVAGVYPGRQRLLLGREATQDAFETQAQRFRILHLAAHASFDQLDPTRSSLELAAGDKLTVREILSMNLAADLVTLSACQTALGGGYFVDVPPGDDFLSLHRAFLFAGSRAVLASLWEVHDESTSRLMTDVYRRLEISGAARAVAEAQRAMLRGEPRHQHPYYWSAFVLSGGSRQIEAKN